VGCVEHSPKYFLRQLRTAQLAALAITVNDCRLAQLKLASSSVIARTFSVLFHDDSFNMTGSIASSVVTPGSSECSKRRCWIRYEAPSADAKKMFTITSLDYSSCSDVLLNRKQFNFELQNAVASMFTVRFWPSRL